ncbi:MAG: hypothetical protein PHX74_09940 [Candidatus Sumerlaeales bacterium]|nr:hypothetical protein [Candidatus Sumerlaeales bacterium]
MKLFATISTISACCLFAATLGADTTDSKRILCDFESFKPYRGEAAIWQGEPKLKDNADISFTKGVDGKAMKIVYKYQGTEQCQYAGFHSWMYTIEKFDTPIDISRCDGFSFMIRNTQPKDDMSISFYLKDIHGQWIRLMNNNILKTRRDIWTEYTSPLVQAPAERDKPYGHGLQTDLWFGNGKAIDLSAITQIAINFYDAETVKRNGKFTIELDSFAVFEGDKFKTPIMTFDFGTSSPQKWKDMRGGQSVIQDKALCLTTTNEQWVFKGTSTELDKVTDMSNLAYAMVQVTSDPKLSHINPTLDIRLIDTKGNIASCLIYGILLSDTQATGFAPVHAAGFLSKDFYDKSCWRYGTFINNCDENSDFDIKKVHEIAIGVEPQSPCETKTSTTIKIKKLVLGGTSIKP